MPTTNEHVNNNNNTDTPNKPVYSTDFFLIQADTQPELTKHLQQALRRAVVDQNLGKPVPPIAQGQHSMKSAPRVSGHVQGLAGMGDQHDIGAMESGGAQARGRGSTRQANNSVMRVQPFNGGEYGAKIVPAVTDDESW